MENHAIYTHVRSATIDYFHYLFSLSFFFFSFLEIKQFISIFELQRTRTYALMSDGTTPERRYKQMILFT